MARSLRVAPSRRKGARQVGDPGVDRAALRLAFGDARRDLRRFVGDLRAPLLRGFRGLPQLHELDLEVVRAPLLGGHRLALGVIGLLGPGQLRVDGVALGRRLGRTRARAGNRAFELVELALAREHAVQLVVGREENDGLRGHEVSRGRHERLADRERLALGQRRGEVCRGSECRRARRRARARRPAA